MQSMFVSGLNKHASVGECSREMAEKIRCYSG